VPSRRAVLALPAAGLAAVGLAAAGCTGARSGGAPVPSSADLAAAASAARTERDLLAGYDAAIARHPGLAALLGGLRAQHAQHLAALAAQVPTLATATPSDGSGGSPSGTAGTAGTASPRVPASAFAPGNAGPSAGVDDSPPARAAALTQLAAAERTAADAHRAGCLAATTSLVPLLASLRAAESCHADLLSLAGSTG